MFDIFTPKKFQSLGKRSMLLTLEFLSTKYKFLGAICQYNVLK